MVAIIPNEQVKYFPKGKVQKIPIEDIISSIEESGEYQQVSEINKISEQILERFNFPVDYKNSNYYIDTGYNCSFKNKEDTIVNTFTGDSWVLIAKTWVDSNNFFNIHCAYRVKDEIHYLSSFSYEINNIYNVNEQGNFILEDSYHIHNHLNNHLAEKNGIKWPSPAMCSIGCFCHTLVGGLVHHDRIIESDISF